MRKRRFLSVIAASLILTNFAFGDTDTNADGASSFVDAMAKAKGLIVRAPLNEKGEVNTSAAEYRMDLGETAIDSEKALPAAWDKAFDIKGYAEVTKPEEESKDASTCYYYQPVVYWNTYAWNFGWPVYTWYPVYYTVYRPVYVYYYYYIVW